jgi:hypothetical protein
MGHDPGHDETSDKSLMNCPVVFRISRPELFSCPFNGGSVGYCINIVECLGFVKVPSERCGKQPAGVGTIATLS